MTYLHRLPLTWLHDSRDSDSTEAVQQATVVSVGRSFKHGSSGHNRPELPFLIAPLRRIRQVISWQQSGLVPRFHCSVLVSPERPWNRFNHSCFLRFRLLMACWRGDIIAEESTGAVFKECGCWASGKVTFAAAISQRNTLEHQLSDGPDSKAHDHALVSRPTSGMSPIHLLLCDSGYCDG